MDRYDSLNVSKPMIVNSPEECSWYHCFDLPDGRYIHGRWDFRGQEDGLLGNIPYRGKSVLEVGPASGFLTRAMEKRGADVLCVDVDPSSNWDIAPRLDRDTEAYAKARTNGIKALWKGWWYTRNAFNGNSRIVYSGAKSIDLFPAELTFDIALVSCVLQHFENPYVILSKIAKRCQTIVVTDLYFPRLDMPGRALAEFVPAKRNNDLGSWWLLSASTVTQMMETLNFDLVSEDKMTFRRNRLQVRSFDKDKFDMFQFYCNVYRKIPVDSSKFSSINEA